MGRDARWALVSVGAGILAIAALLAVASGVFSGSPAAQDTSVIALPTQDLVPGMACNGALLEGELVVRPDGTVTIRGRDSPIFWPLGYVGRARNDRLEIIDL